MKDIVISAGRIKTELKFMLYCYIAANLVNVYAILNYNTNWIELLTWQRLIILFAFIFYITTATIRLIFFGIKKLFRKTERVKT
jgi:hypothetical protein